MKSRSEACDPPIGALAVIVIVAAWSATQAIGMIRWRGEVQARLDRLDPPAATDYADTDEGRVSK